MSTTLRNSARGLALATTLTTGKASACAVCFGDPSSLQTQGVNMAMLTLLGVTGVVQVAFAASFIAFWRRAKRLEREGLEEVGEA